MVIDVDRTRLFTACRLWDRYGDLVPTFHWFNVERMVASVPTAEKGVHARVEINRFEFVALSEKDAEKLKAILPEDLHNHVVVQEIKNHRTF